MLKLKNLCKTFNPNTANERIALNGVDFSAEKGDFVTILGSNGAGKSTMLSAIAGDFIADNGSIFLNGSNITFQSEYKRAQSIGRLFQDPLKGTAPSMTIEENLALAYLRANKKSLFSSISAQDRDFFREKLEQLGLGLENRLKTPVGILSGGQRQALTLLMATLVTPKLLLLDEHTAALDPSSAEKISILTKQIVREGQITCLMVTHNIQNALECGNRTIMMNNGKILLELSGEERQGLTVQSVLELFKQNAAAALDNDRMLLT